MMEVLSKIIYLFIYLLIIVPRRQWNLVGHILCSLKLMLQITQAPGD